MTKDQVCGPRYNATNVAPLGPLDKGVLNGYLVKVRVKQKALHLKTQWWVRVKPKALYPGPRHVEPLRVGGPRYIATNVAPLGPLDKGVLNGYLVKVRVKQKALH